MKVNLVNESIRSARNQIRDGEGREGGDLTRSTPATDGQASLMDTPSVLPPGVMAESEIRLKQGSAHPSTTVLHPEAATESMATAVQATIDHQIITLQTLIQQLAEQFMTASSQSEPSPSQLFQQAIATLQTSVQHLEILRHSLPVLDQPVQRPTHDTSEDTVPHLTPLHTNHLGRHDHHDTTLVAAPTPSPSAAIVHPAIPSNVAAESAMAIAPPSPTYHRTEAALRQTEERFRRLVESTHVIPWEADLDTHQYAYIGPQIVNLLGYPLDYYYNTPNAWMQNIHPADRQWTLDQWQRRVLEYDNYELEYRMVAVDGRIVWMRHIVHVERPEVGAGKLWGFFLDITLAKRLEEIHERNATEIRALNAELEQRVLERTAALTKMNQELANEILERQQTEAALRHSEARFRAIFQQAAVGIVRTSLDGHFLQVNQRFCEIVGYSEAELSRQTSETITHGADWQEHHYNVQKLLSGEVPTFSLEKRYIRKDGQVRWVNLSISLMRDRRGNPDYFICIVEDIQERKQAEDQLLYNAFYDSLTGLPNRALFMDRLNQTITHTHRHPADQFALLFIDLDRFKVVNDSLGHLAGDRLLVQVAQRLQACIQEGDTVARLGGDEFAILLQDVQSIGDVTYLADQIREQLSHPFVLHEQEFFVNASIGIVLSTSKPYKQMEDLLRDADIAMYQAKHRGGACYQVYDCNMHSRHFNRLQLETDLRRAIARGELVLVYQPIISVQTNRIASFEALIRWQHPERGLLSPNLFLPMADETGIILNIGEWVLRQACQRLQQWRSQGLADPSVAMNVNLAGRQFGQPGLVEQIRTILAETQLPPANLHLEITEDIIMEHGESVADRLYQLQALGVHLSIDDFGTGYSSLSRLSSFPINTLKIDRSFIAQMEGRVANKAIVNSILNLATSMDMTVVAEGVESMEQLVKLRSLGCHYVQGYLFSRPLSDAEAVLFIRQQGTGLTPLNENPTPL